MISRRQRGFTLIELIMFIVIVGIGVAGVLSVFTTSVKNSADPMVRKQALAIAESLLEEILLKEFQDPAVGGTNGTPGVCNAGAGANRSLWTNVCEYINYASTGIRDVQGNNIATLGGYSAAVAVTTVPVGGQNLKRVFVSVTDTQNNVISIAGYRGNDR